MRPELVGTSRARLLQVLRANSEPMSSHDLAEACDLHVTTVRFHLEILSDSGLIDASLQRHGRGRPRLLYTLSATAPDDECDQPPNVAETSNPENAPAADGSTDISTAPGDTLGAEPPPGPTGPDSHYQDLALLLAAHWDDTSGSPAARARQAGRQAANPPLPAKPRARTRRVSAPSAKSGGEMTVAHAARLISAEFAERGFAPELSLEGPTTVIRLKVCPFQAVAQTHPEVVCALHLGLLQGSWEKLGAPPIHASLHPFSGPGLCFARLTPTPDAAASTSELVHPEGPGPSPVKVTDQ